jgi:superoxide dismutase, Fe-Mn family
MLRKFSSFKLPKLPFDISSLEPLYDKKTLEFHWGKHHQTYVDRLNSAVGDGKLSLLEVIEERAQHSLPLRNNGGGHYNHCLFWLCLGTGQEKPSGKLLTHILSQWGDFETFKKEFSQAAINTFGSGWAWLSLNPENKLVISSSPNQDNPLMKGIYKANSVPFFTLDVWEHAYYLQYQNKRPEFVDKFWKIINWKKIEEMYETYALNHIPVPVDSLLE